ncbi:MAG TPA: GDSL-type esterase/lipase family protein [Abditibacterium sp.]|jgi:lysophospholipase L1-like esterase
MNKFSFIEALQHGRPQTLVVYGTSLSQHLAPILRDALAQNFGDKISVINAGLPAKASRSGLQQLDSRVLQQPVNALLLEFGINDAFTYDNYSDDTLDKGISIAESKANLEAMVDRVQQAQPQCEIVLQTMNPAYDSAHNEDLAGTRRPHLADFYSNYRRVAMARGLKLIDHAAMWEELKRRDLTRFETLIPDGVHPTPLALRSVVVPFMLRVLGVNSPLSHSRA